MKIVLPAVEEHRIQRDRCQAEDNDLPEVDLDERRSVLISEELEDSDTFDERENDETDNEYWSESDDSERVLQENCIGQLMKMYEDLRLE